VVRVRLRSLRSSGWCTPTSRTWRSSSTRRCSRAWPGTSRRPSIPQGGGWGRPGGVVLPDGVGRRSSSNPPFGDRAKLRSAPGRHAQCVRRPHHPIAGLAAPAEGRRRQRPPSGVSTAGR
jgi:hypothetical protein